MSSLDLLTQTASLASESPSPARSTSGGLTRAGSLPATLSRSATRAAAPPAPLEWRRFLTVEERTNVRNKIKAAYGSQCKSYEDLLETVTAIEEELLHMSAPSRLDYFKASVQFGSRVRDKRKQLDAGEDAEAGRGAKRARPDSEPAAAAAAPAVSQDSPTELTQEC